MFVLWLYHLGVLGPGEGHSLSPPLILRICKLSIVYHLPLGELYFEALYREDNSIIHTAIHLAIIHAGLYLHVLIMYSPGMFWFNALLSPPWPCNEVMGICASIC